MLEGDSEVVIKDLRSEDESFATFGHLLSSIKPTNAIVHNLAKHETKHERQVSDFSVWMKGCSFTLL